MGKTNYADNYYILNAINFENKFISACIYDNNNNTLIYITDIDEFKGTIDTIATNTPKKQRTKIYINKESEDFLPEHKEIDYTDYNKILDNYTSFIISFDKDYLINNMKKLIPQIKFYVNKLGLHKFRHSNPLSGFGTIAARCIETDYPDLVNTENALLVKERVPPSQYVRIMHGVKPYGANCIITQDKSYGIYTDMCKYDFDSSFQSVPLLYKTFDKIKPAPRNCDYLERIEYILNNMNTMGFIAKIRFKKHPIRKYSGFVNWLYKRDTDIDVHILKDVIYLSHLGWEDLFACYEIDINNIEILGLYELSMTTYLPHQIELIRRMHKDKSVAKEQHNELEKNKIKKTIHCLHGRAQLNSFLDTEYYKAWWFFKNRTIYNTGDMIYSYADSLMMYENARHNIIKLMLLCRQNGIPVVYTDTDCIVVPDTKKMSLVCKEYNNYITKLYEEKGLNIEDFTHSGHTIGFLEYETHYDKFTFEHGKFYLFEIDGKLHSTTAGYPTDLIADKLEEYTGLKGMEAYLKFPELKTITLGYVNLGTDKEHNYLSPCVWFK